MGFFDAIFGKVNVQEPDAAKAQKQKDDESLQKSVTDQGKANQAQKLAGYEKQLTAAESGEADFIAAESRLARESANAARDLNRQGAATAARSRNLGTLRGMADQTGIARAQMGTQYEQQQMANAAQRRLAQQQAGALQSTLAEERQKALVNETTGKQDALNQLYSQIDDIGKAKDEAQSLYLSDADVAEAADEMRKKVLAGVYDQEQRKLLEQYIQKYIDENT
jgi:hypothetical protein